MITIIDEDTIEHVIAKSIEIGVVNTLSRLGLTSEVITENQARKQYGRRLIQEWRSKRWIVGYPTGNPQKAKVYFKRTELETARLMAEIMSVVQFNESIK